MIQNTIRTLFAAGDIDGIINQVEILIDDRARVRAENDGFKHEIRRLAQAFANITEPLTGRKVSDPHPTIEPGTIKKTLNGPPTTSRPPPPKPQTLPKPSKEPLDLDI